MLRQIPRFVTRCSSAALVLAWMTGCAPYSSFHSISAPRVKPNPNALTLFVSTAGNDTWSGRLAEPNPAKTDGPFASLTHARDTVRELKAKGALETPVDVLTRGGTYYLASTFTLEPQDSGTAACPVTYGAYRSEKPILSGGRRLIGWTLHRGKIWACSLKTLGLNGLRFKQLFYRGKRQVLARYPNFDPVRPRTGGFLYMDRKAQKNGKWFFWYPVDEFPRKWSRPEEVEIEYFRAHNWQNAIVPLAKLMDKENRIAAPGHGGRPRTISGNRFYIRNALEELDCPGEWYLDRRTDTVYFWPPDGELPRVGAVTPAIETVVLFQGDFDRGQFVEHVKLSHLGIECCEGHGAVLRAARHCGVVGCAVLKVGRTGIVIGAGSSFCRVAGNDVFHPGGHAIATYYNVVSPQACSDNVITNNYAHHCGEILVCSFGWGSGICISGRRNVVSHNLVHDTAYNPMNFDGWDHVMEYNVFHHGNLECTDCGAFYGWVNTKGGSGRNIIRFNLIHDMIGYGMPEPGRFQSPYYSWGIYLDDHISTTTVFGNLVYRTCWGGLMIHGGWNNVVENNIFAEGATSQIYLANMKPDKYASMKTPAAGHPGSMSGNKIRRNIIYYTNPQACLYRGHSWTDAAAAAEQNLIWHQDMPLDMRLKGFSWSTWLEKGQDTTSVVADPKFVDPAGDDYRLRPDSPALKLGFQPLPIEKMGLVRSPERASWPVVEPEVYRDPFPAPPPPPTKPSHATQLRSWRSALVGRSRSMGGSALASGLRSVSN